MNTKFEGFLKRHLRMNTVRNDKHIKYTASELKDLIDASIDLFKSEPALGQINPPCVLVGDIHGQYFDLLRMFSMFTVGNQHGAMTQKYVFLGDYVDRGRRSLECVALVLTLKICFPRKFIVLRGNHETQAINQIYGFYEELLDRFDKEEAEILYKGFNEVFAWMPFAGLIGRKILCMHGGISKHMKSLDDIRNIPRPLDDLSTNALAMDLLWADPMVNLKGFAPNSIRGVASFFGEDTVQACCEKFGLELIVRGHQMMMTGYGFFANRKLCTIFTAPRYQADTGNNGAVMMITNEGKVGFRILAPNEIQEEINVPAAASNSSSEEKNSSVLARKFSSASSKNTQGPKTKSLQ